MPTLEEKLAFLCSLCGSGDEVIETHFAWVFLIGQLAYKLRKPVRRDTMDYSTLEARRFDSQEELRLNRRLAPAFYLDAVPLTLAAGGSLAIDGRGKAVEWLVKMRRLDRSLFLDAMLERRATVAPGLEQVVALLGNFYANLPPAITDPAALTERLRGQVEANFLVLSARGGLDATTLRELQRQSLSSLREELERRVEEGFIVECHGDLRPEHLYLGEPVAVIDCLEFDRDLRIMDRAEELCFFELECQVAGYASVGECVRAGCLQRIGDHASGPLLAFYRSHRAATRAKLYVWRADEPDGDTPEAWHRRAARYVDLACRELLRNRP